MSYQSDPLRQCQYASICSATELIASELSTIDKLKLLWRRGVASLTRRSLRMVNSFSATNSSNSSEKSMPTDEIAIGSLQKGDRVKIRPIDEIRASLKDGKTRGLEFMPGMERFCGQELRVLKAMRYMFDERAWIMRKCNCILLEGAICDGQGVFDKEGCDRCCFYFWKEEWLQRM